MSTKFLGWPMFMNSFNLLLICRTCMDGNHEECCSHSKLVGVQCFLRHWTWWNAVVQKGIILIYTLKEIFSIYCDISVVNEGLPKFASRVNGFSNFEVVLLGFRDRAMFMPVNFTGKMRWKNCFNRFTGNYPGWTFKISSKHVMWMAH